MVKIINVKCDGKTASCNFYAESDGMTPEDAGFVRVNRENVVELIPMKGYEKDDYCPYLNHAAAFLYQTFNMETIPDTRVIYWY